MTASFDESADCELHQLRAGDVGAIAERCHALLDDTAWTAGALEKALAAPGYFALLAHTAEQAAGLVLGRTAADECEILWIVVGASFRRQGLGRRLLRAALRHAASLGAGTAYLEVAETNRAATALYGAEGFQLCGRRTAYYRDARNGRPEDALLLRKPLSPRSVNDSPGQPQSGKGASLAKDEDYTFWPNSWAALRSR
jgi:ribosomal-protein-alanine N-acetyltransferase